MLYIYNMKKTCAKCKEDKDLSEFAKKKGGTQPYCKSCNKEVHKIYYKENKAKYRENTLRNIQRAKEFLDELRKDGCSKCGEKHIACLDFHHVDPSAKSYNIGMYAYKGYSPEHLKKETDKCIILCSNCHRKLHYEEKQQPKP